MQAKLYKQQFRTHEGCLKRCKFERAHAGQRRDNVNYRFFVVRCLADGTPDCATFDSNYARKPGYVYRIERTLSDTATDPRVGWR